MPAIADTVPGAPQKVSTRKQVESYFNTVEQVLLDWQAPAVLQTTDNLEDPKVYDSLFPEPPADVENKIEFLDDITSFQYYAFTSTGLADDSKKTLSRYLSTGVAPVVDTPSKSLPAKSKGPIAGKGKGKVTTG